MLTDRSDELERIIGLELVADRYLPKPINPRELLARHKAILRRRTPRADSSPVLRFGRLSIEPGARQGRLDGEPPACAATPGAGGVWSGTRPRTRTAPASKSSSAPPGGSSWTADLARPTVLLPLRRDPARLRLSAGPPLGP
jgi:hypothetical protein